jgi:hypothetical protein
MALRYWVGGTGTWDSSSTVNWAASSGGASGSAVPTTSDDVIIDNNSGAGFITTAAGATAGSVTYTSITVTSLTLGAALTLGGTGSFSFNASTLNLANQILTVNSFTSNSSNTSSRVIQFGSGNITIVGSVNNFWDVRNMATISYTGTPTVYISSNTTTTGTLTHGSLSGGAAGTYIDFNVTAGNYTLEINANSYLRGLNFTTGFTGKVLFNSLYAHYGDLTFHPDMAVDFSSYTTNLRFNSVNTSQLVTHAGKRFYAITQSTNGGQVRYSSGSLTLAESFTLSSGNLDLGTLGCNLSCASFSNSNTNLRSITFGSSNSITVTGNGTVLSMGTTTNFSHSGNSAIYLYNVTNTTGSTLQISSGITGGGNSSALNIYVMNGYSTFSITNNSHVRSLTFNSGFTGIWNLSNPNQLRIWGDLVLTTSMTVNALPTSYWGFVSGTGTQYITTAGKTLNPIQISSLSTVQLLDNLSIATTGALLITSGTFDANNRNITAAAVLMTSATTKALIMGSGIWNLTGSGTIWSSNATGTSLTPSTSTIITSNSGAKTFSSTGLTYYNLINTGTGALTLAGSNTFNNLAALAGCALTFSSNSITTSNTFTFVGTSSLPITITSTSTQAFTLAKRGGCIVDMQYVNMANCTASPVTNTWYAGNSTNSGSNSGITFSSAPALLGFI